MHNICMRTDMPSTISASEQILYIYYMRLRERINDMSADGYNAKKKGEILMFVVNRKIYNLF